MNRDPARELALEILLRVERSGAFASVLLEHHEARLADPRDAALLHEVVLGVLRRRAQLDHVLRQLASRPPERMEPEVVVALRIGAYGLLFLDRVPDFAAVDSAVRLVARRRPSAKGFVNAVLRRVGAGGRARLPADPDRGDVAGLALRQSHPEWWVRRLVAREGWDGARSLLEANNEPAPTVLRVNLRRSDAETLAADLRRRGCATEPGRVVPESLRIVKGRAPREYLFEQGRAWVQDEASQCVPLLFGAASRERTLDVCAAPGTKTMQLTEGVGAGALLVAVDRHRGRLTRVRRAAARLGVDQPLLIQADMSREPAPVGGVFDRVLVDAPCSGTGTMRRRPEIRWRLGEGDLAALARRQTAILETAAELTAARGRVVYSVCSMEPEEGERVVRRFLDGHDEFRPVAAESPAPRTRSSGENGFLRTSPVEGGLDGFFAACLERVR